MQLTDRFGYEGLAVRPARCGRRFQVGPGRAAISGLPGTNQVFTIHNINSGNGSLRGRLVRTRKRSYVPAFGYGERVVHAVMSRVHFALCRKCQLC